MSWLKSRRLHYLAGLTALLFVIFAALRMLFLLGFSAVESISEPDVLPTLGIGLRFDLRLALLLMLPVGILLALPKLRLARFRAMRWLLRGYLVLAVAALGLLYIIDFGHYAYLGVRLNATVLRFAGDAQISAGMLWQTYPVLWITLAWLAGVALWAWALLRLERVTLDRPQAQRVGVLPAIGGAAVVGVLVFFGLLGRASAEPGEPGAAALERRLLQRQQPDRCAWDQSGAVSLRHPQARTRRLRRDRHARALPGGGRLPGRQRARCAGAELLPPPAAAGYRIRPSARPTWSSSCSNPLVPAPWGPMATR